MSEFIQIDARLIGNVTGNVYAQNSMSVESNAREPELYMGDCLLSIPMHPSGGPPYPDLDPEDEELILQFRTDSEETRLGRSPVSPFLFIGHWKGWIDVRARATVEIQTNGPS